MKTTSKSGSPRRAAEQSPADSTAAALSDIEDRPAKSGSTDVRLSDAVQTSSETGPNDGPVARAGEVSGEAIARRAYELFLARGGEAGREAEDWFAAERELRAGDESR